MAKPHLKRVQTLVDDYYNYNRNFIGNFHEAKGEPDDLGAHGKYLLNDLAGTGKLYPIDAEYWLVWAVNYARALEWDPDDLSSWIYDQYNKTSSKEALSPEDRAEKFMSWISAMLNDLKVGVSIDNQINLLKSIMEMLIRLEKSENMCFVYKRTREETRMITHPFCLRPDLKEVIVKMTSLIDLPVDITHEELVQQGKNCYYDFPNSKKNYLAKCTTGEKQIAKMKLIECFDQKLSHFSYLMKENGSSDKLFLELRDPGFFLDERKPNLMKDYAYYVSDDPNQKYDRIRWIVISFFALLNFASHLGVDLIEERLNELDGKKATI